MLPNPAQVTQLTPTPGAGQIAVDPNTNLLDILQQLVKQNAPATNINQATPDQTAAAAASVKAKTPVAETPQVAAPAAPQETGKLPGLLNFLDSLGISPEENPKVSGGGTEGSKKKSGGKEDKITRAVEGVSKIVSLLGML